jgi:hypothetical protein
MIRQHTTNTVNAQEFYSNSAIRFDGLLTSTSRLSNRAKSTPMEDREKGFFL